MERGRQMTAFEAGAPLRRQRRIRPSRVDRPNWKAECAETCLLRLERGKGCKALPIATLAGAIPPGYPAEAHNGAWWNNVTLPSPKGGSKQGTQSTPKHWRRPLYSTYNFCLPHTSLRRPLPQPEPTN